MWSIFGAFAAGGHFDKFGVELAEGGHEVLLGGHDFGDVFVGHRDFIEAGADEGDTAFVEETVDIFPVEFFVGGFAAHGAARAVRGGVERIHIALSTHDISGRGHGTGNDAEDARARRGGTFAMHDDLALHAGDEVLFFPREVVMVLDVKYNFRAEIFGDVLVDAGMVRGGVAAHQFHGVPVFLAFLGIQRQPGEAFQFAR